MWRPPYSGCLRACPAMQSEAGISAICARACRESSQYAPRSSFSSQNGHADILRSGGHERPRASAENERYNQAAAGQAPLPGRLSAVPKRRQVGWYAFLIHARVSPARGACCPAPCLVEHRVWSAVWQQSHAAARQTAAGCCQELSCRAQARVLIALLQAGSAGT